MWFGPALTAQSRHNGPAIGSALVAASRRSSTVRRARIRSPTVPAGAPDN
jgi:hypothetical protein